MKRYLILSGLLALLPFYALYYENCQDSNIFLFGSILLTTFLQLIVPLIKLFSKKSDIFEPFFIFLFLFQFFYFIHPFFILFDGGPLNPIVKIEYHHNHMITMYYYINLSLISYYIGYFSLNIHKIDIYYIDKHRFTNSTPKNNEIFSRNIALAYIFVGLISFFFIVKGSMLNFIMNLNLRLLMIRGHGFLVFLSFFLGVGILLYFCYTLLWSKKLYKLLNIFFVICLLGIYLFEGSRGRVFIIVLSMMVWYHYRIKRIALKKVFKIALVVFVIFFGFHIFRSFKSWKQNDIDFEKKIGSTHAIVKTMFSQTEKLLPIINKKPPELLKGKSYLSPIMVWIPKFLYPDKAKIGIGHFYTNYYFPNAYNKGVSYGPGPIGDSILNFGIPGIIINFMLFGLVLNRIYNSLAKKYNSPFYIVCYSILVSIVCFTSVSQNMINSITLLMFFFVPLLIYKYIVDFKFVIKNILYSKFRTVVFDPQLKF